MLKCQKSTSMKCKTVLEINYDGSCIRQNGEHNHEQNETQRKVLLIRHKNIIKKCILTENQPRYKFQQTVNYT